MNILNINSGIDTSEIKFSSPCSVAASGALMVPFSYQARPIYFETPIVVCPMGFRLFPGASTHKLFINPTPEMCSIIEHLDSFIIESIFQNSSEWFNKSFKSKEILEELFYSTLKITTKYPPSMKVRMRFNTETGLPLFTVFDSNRNEILFQENENVLEKLTDILRGRCHLRLILSNASIWSVSGRYGYGWDCVQMMICSSVAPNLKSCMFTEEENLESLV